MRLFRSFAALMMGVAALAVTVPVQAAPISGAMSAGLTTVAPSGALLTEVQYRPRARTYYRGGGRYYGGYRGGYGGPYYGGYRGGYYRGYYGNDAAVGLLGGLLLGSAIVGSAQPYYPGYRSVDYCVRRFRSYDPASGTYLGYDGRRHRCP